MLRPVIAVLCLGFYALCPGMLEVVHGANEAPLTKAGCPVIDPEGEIAEHISFLSDQEKESFKATIDGRRWLVRHEESRPMTVSLFSSHKNIFLIGADKGVCTYHMDEPAFSTLFTLTPLKG